ncbi:glycosyltransferase [Clostridium intestinale]|uniref:Glycosyltransferase, catalytic subunit of cellulose synthase and poly-beta-1,6-N-acetylglucosamine synthase n=1 Tax=Clostridium intestinale DSM 6191 TaxID=1121320 RepID=A0A1M6DN33_9CLOT|nr:glycosyltransferase [Clostridium intestinale]SHI74519.1 Glycosyltransferase, catalytic subunit of cellulose synthase and poly-beta-1,6-N-acetylglucosamine synthase [Clostridium intestinale DSM 6191]
MGKIIEDVSIISTVYNEEKNIASFLESLLNMTVLPKEIIIVDAGSKDNTVEIIKKYSKIHSFIKLMISNGCNIAKGRNVAIENATNSIIAVTDAGCEIDKFWLEKIILPFKDSNIDVVSGWYKPLIKNKFQEITSQILFSSLDQIDKESFLPSSRSIAFKKESWKKINGYPEHLTFAGEDTLFDIKLKNEKNIFFFQPEAYVYWEPRENVKQFKKQIFYYSLGDAEASNMDFDYIKKIIFYIINFILLICAIKIPAILLLNAALFLIKYRVVFQKNKKYRLNLFFVYIYLEIIQIYGFISGKLNRDVIRKNKEYMSSRCSDER